MSAAGERPTQQSRPPRKTAARSQATRNALADGAARAGGERARRRGTPLVPSEPIEREDAAAPEQPAPPTEADPTSSTTSDRPAPERPRKHRPAPKPRVTTPSARVIATEGGRQHPSRRPSPSRRRALQAVPDLPDHATPADPAASAGESPVRRRPPRRSFAAGSEGRAVQGQQGEGAVTPYSPPEAPAGERSPATVTPGVEDLLQAGIAALRTLISATGVSPEEVERQVAAILAYARRRLTGDFTIDDFGFDEDFTLNAYLPALRPLYQKWFRVEVRGIENIPATGSGLIVANHSGTVAMDSLMTQVAVYDEHPQHRHLRMLAADLVFQTPMLAQMARRSGSTLAANPDAERLLTRGEIVGVWPEGFKGVGKPFSERYKLQRFGRGGFVAAAIRTGAPIIPCSIVGAEEIYPIIGNMKTLARLLGMPYVPVTPTFPWLGPLGLIPLPSKWIIEFGVPVETAELGPGAAEDPMLVFDLTDQIRETIQQTLYALLMQRRSVFF